MDHSGPILDYSNIFSDLTWYHYNGINTLGSNCDLRFKSWSQLKICNSPQIVKGYVLWYGMNS